VTAANGGAAITIVSTPAPVTSVLRSSRTGTLREASNLEPSIGPLDRRHANDRKGSGIGVKINEQALNDSAPNDSVSDCFNVRTASLP
jgi:hypothetical protein